MPQCILFENDVMETVGNFMDQQSENLTPNLQRTGDNILLLLNVKGGLG